MKMGRKIYDARLDIRSTWITDSIVLFLVLIVINGAHMLIYQAIFGIEPTVANMVAPELISFLFFVTCVLCVVTAVLRHYSFNRPMQRLGEAARRIAAGDYSVRIPPLRKDGKKDYMELMIDDFNTMAEELSSTETLKNDFIMNVSHEIRTPLAIMHNYATMLRRERLTDAQREEYSRVIEDTAMSLSTMVSNILRLNRMENSEIVSTAKRFNINEQICQCALAFEEKWDEKDITLEADLLDEAYVFLDEELTEYIWTNLLSNALKFTEPGGTVTISQKNENGYTKISIADTGCGIDEETGRHMFDKFYQGDISHGQEGNGLGLALVKKAIELCGGGITVDSQPGKGSVFTILLEVAL